MYRRWKIVALHHDSRVAGQGQYTATCDLCLCTKAHKQPPTGHLQPLPTPDRLWHTISVDFIVELPESDGHDAIMVVVDSLTKRAHFLQ